MNNTKPGLSLPRILALNAYWVGISFLWNSLHVIILPAVLIHLAPPDLKNTTLGLLTFGGLVIAMIVQPVAGALSDGWRSRWGRRRPFIFLGTMFDFLFLAMLGWAGGLGWLGLGYLGLQVTSNFAHGALQGLLPDRTPPEQVGLASGIKNFLDMFGLVVSSLLVGRLLSPETRQPIGVVALVAAVLAGSAAITLLFTPETSTKTSSTLEGGRTKRLTLIEALRAAAGEIWRFDWANQRDFAWLIVSRLLFLAGIYGIQTFAQYYVRDVLAAANPIQLTGDLLAVITLALVAFAIAGGWLGDRWGHRRVAMAASGVGALGCLLLLWARTPQTLLIFGGVLGVGIGLFLTSNWALANRLAPPAEAGKFLGLTNLATAGAGAFGRLEGPMIDLFNKLAPGAWWGYSALFLLGMGLTLASGVVLLKLGSRKEVAPLRNYSPPPGV